MKVELRRLALAFVVLAGCGGDDKGGLPDAPGSAQLIVEPADLTITVVDGQAVMQPYTATLVALDGSRRDITDEASFSIDSGYGTFSAATLSVTGNGSGPTRVYAVADGVTGDTGLTVHVRRTVVDPSAPPDAPTLFEDATEDPAIAPLIAYPADNILVPPNLGQFDVHWRNPTGTNNNLFRVQLTNEYVDIRLYTTGLDPQNPQPFWTVFQPDTWYPIASSRRQLTLTVSGLDTANPATKGTAAAQHVDVTNENAQGGVYYWSTTTSSIWRYDIARPDVPPEPYFPVDNQPSTCMGCHALSRDGSKLALTLDGAFGRGAVYDVAQQTPLLTTATQPYWNFATFDASATRLVTIENGQMYLRTIDGTILAGPLPSVNGTDGITHPELSPDDSRLVSVDFPLGQDYYAQRGSITIRSFDSATNTFGAPTTLVPFEAATNLSSCYPSFSPDGQWIVFTRTTDHSYDHPSARTWVIKADGSMPPIELATANTATPNLTSSWARWVPFGQTFGEDDEPLFYLTFSTKRPFGVRIPNGGRPQIWMTPFFPARAAMGLDPTGPAFRVPFQDVNTANHIAQWTQAIVIE